MLLGLDLALSLRSLKKHPPHQMLKHQWAPRTRFPVKPNYAQRIKIESILSRCKTI